MSRALLYIHVDSLDGYADEATRDEADEVKNNMISAMDRYDDALVIVVHQGWRTARAREIIAAAQRRPKHFVMEFDESVQSWPSFFLKLGKLLKEHEVESVVLGGCWWDPSKKKGGGRGCATHTYHWLKRKGYAVHPRTELLAADPYLSTSEALAEALEATAARIEAKLSGSSFQALNTLWGTWSQEALQEFYETLRVWHEGTGYMKKEADDLEPTTPFDTFGQKFPAEWQAYKEIVAAGAPKAGVLFRTVLFDQAEEIVDEMLESGDENLISEMWQGLEWQNQLHFGSKPVSNESLTDHDLRINVRRYSSWTSKAMVAYKLSYEGGMYQIGNGAVIVRAGMPHVKIVHTFDAAKEFVKFGEQNPDKIHGFSKSFMGQWYWQLEYVVESESGVVNCNGVQVIATEGGSDDYGQGFYERFSEAASVEDDEDDDDE